MLMGLLGPAEGNATALREGVEFLLGDVAVDEAIYLGDDNTTIDEMIAGWSQEIFGGEASDDAFLERAVRIAQSGTPDQIEQLLSAEAALRRLSTVKMLPPQPSRAVEMLGDRIVLAVHDKSVLDEEDIANAHLIVYGKSHEARLKRFGPRYFLTPGPLQAGRVAVLELETDGQISIGLFETSGLPVWRERMAKRAPKMQVVQ